MSRKRRNFSPKVIQERLKHSGYQCEGILPDGTPCLAPVSRGRFQCDHDNPDGLTGEPVFANARILCTSCHLVKTKSDIKRISKAKRVEAKHQGIATPSQRPIQGRGFEKVAKTPKRPTKVCAVDRRPLWRP